MTPLRRPRRARRLARLSALAMVAGLIGGMGATASRADTDPEERKAQVEQEITNLNDDLDEISADLVDAYRALEATKAKVPAAQAALDQALAAEASAQAAHNEAVSQLQVARARVARGEEQLAATEAKIETTRTEVARFAAEIYTEQGMGQLSVAMDAQSPQEFADRLALSDTIMDVQQSQISSLAAARADQRALTAELAAERALAAKAEKAAQEALAASSAAREKADAAKNALDALVADQTTQAAALEKAKAADQAKLAAAQDEQQQILDFLAERARQAKAKDAAKGGGGGSGSTAPPSQGGYLSPPVNARVSSEFGLRFHPIYHYWKLHAGRDYAAPVGTPVYAPADGTVIKVDHSGSGGNRLFIDHGIVRGVNLVTAYKHLSRFAVTSGHVKKGQVIAYVGNTGASTGAHLHFETIVDGTPVDPRRWL